MPKLNILTFFLKQHPIRLIFIILLAMLASSFEALNVFLLFALFNSLVGLDAANIIGSDIINKVNVLIKMFPVTDSLIAICILVIIFVILKSLFSFSHKLFSAYTAFKIWQETKENIYKKFLDADYQYFLENKQGELIFKTYVATGSAGSVFKWVPDIIFESSRLFMLTFSLSKISLSVTFTFIILALGYYYLIRNIAKFRSYKYSKSKIVFDQKEVVLVNEMIDGIRHIKIAEVQNQWMNKYKEILRNFFSFSKKERFWQLLPNHIIEAATITLLSCLLIIFKLRNPHNFISVVPLIGAFGYAFLKILPSMSALGLLRITITETMPSVEIVYNSLNEKTCFINDGDREVADLNKGVYLKNVHFSYPNRPEVVNGINIYCKKGEKTAIVGLSGSGKTTIANLLVRLFIPQRGQILIDDLDLNDCKISSWLNKVGFVTQDSFIFNSSIADNISFGLSIDKNQIIQAAKEANAHEFILGLSEGYDTLVGDKGMKLSGGQRQRIAIARALLRRPEVLILDEATSSLDNISVAQVQEAIDRISKNHTTILIAHRLSSVINADKIVVIDHGKVVEEGNHTQLMAKRGLYWSIYNSEDSAKQKPNANDKEAIIQ
jgi:ABC-type multidrug transport system fused ATPase/permease subunit